MAPNQPGNFHVQKERLSKKKIEKKIKKLTLTFSAVLYSNGQECHIFIAKKHIIAYFFSSLTLVAGAGGSTLLSLAGMEASDPHVVSSDVSGGGGLISTKWGFSLGLHPVFSDATPRGAAGGASVQSGGSRSPGSPFSIC